MYYSLEKGSILVSHSLSLSNTHTWAIYHPPVPVPELHLEAPRCMTACLTTLVMFPRLSHLPLLFCSVLFWSCLANVQSYCPPLNPCRANKPSHISTTSWAANSLNVTACSMGVLERSSSSSHLQSFPSFRFLLHTLLSWKKSQLLTDFLRHFKTLH